VDIAYRDKEELSVMSLRFRAASDFALANLKP
jgi:hypothetical protein